MPTSLSHEKSVASKVYSGRDCGASERVQISCCYHYSYSQGFVMATSKATSSKIDASVIPADPCDLDFFMAKFAAVYCIVFRFFILNLIQVSDLLLKVHLSLYALLDPRDVI